MQKAQEAAAVAVTKRRRFLTHTKHLVVALAGALLMPCAYAAVLPEDRADVLLHNYSGDGSTFKGPSILVRKQFKETVSVWGNYYIDMNSAASIDVVTQGSPYEEVRDEASVGFDYLHNKTLLSASIKNSSENDYEADSYALGLSQDFFGDMSTFTMGYSAGSDDVYQNIRDGNGADDIIGRTYFGSATHERFSLGWSQIFTKNWIVSLNAEASVDEGFLRNPYRSSRFIAQDDGINIDQGREQENYPTTRSSQAYAIKSMYFLPWRGALRAEYRGFNDSWDISAFNYEFRYVHRYKENWTFELRYRYYDQTQASFYSELFDFAGQFDFRASDKELSTFHNTTTGFGITYEFNIGWLSWVDRATANLYVDRVNYQYDNFLDKRVSAANGSTVNPGDEPAFEFDATISRLFLSIWY